MNNLETVVCPCALCRVQGDCQILSLSRPALGMCPMCQACIDELKHALHEIPATYKPCEICLKPFPIIENASGRKGRSDRKYCSPACRATSSRSKKTV